MTNDITKNNDEKPIQIMQSISVYSTLPPPEWMQKYKDIDSEIITKILESYSENGKMARNNELKETNIIMHSQWHGFIVSVIIILSIVASAFFNQEKVALALITLPLLGLVQSLIRK